MMQTLNGLVHAIEDVIAQGWGEELDIDAFAASHATTGYHLRRMFSSLAGISISEYVRRRRMTLAATDLLGPEDLLSIATRYGYGSVEAFGRAFRLVHGVSHGEVRRQSGSLRNQPIVKFRLTVEGAMSMDTRIIERPAFALIGHAARVPLIHRGINEHIQRHIASIPQQEHQRLKMLGNTTPTGILQVSVDVDPDYEEGSELTYLHAVAVEEATQVPNDLDRVTVQAGWWVVFRTSGAYPSVVHDAYAASATEWFPSNPWRLRNGPSMVSIVERAEDFSTATCELWLPIERG
ncbi:AraC family transcriptional regulator [Corynebacterium sp. SCR221107]|uniref:AraC family transcriptional regulator n=1 Tax=Corynebacterium sp. SCR221107 TaxID=3017361 RepID=UPI0022EC52AD|nr:AraC family transcriptional regulator [Corynebacterium sp. SCR221107]WBT09673.1 AraC family transcriptional regulator [Corynebacterium sp. SCR221107]